MATRWRRRADGWYRSPLGGIIQLESGIWFYVPIRGKCDRPFTSLRDAKQFAEDHRGVLDVTENTGLDTGSGR